MQGPSSWFITDSRSPTGFGPILVTYRRSAVVIHGRKPRPEQQQQSANGQTNECGVTEASWSGRGQEREDFRVKFF